MSLASFEPTTAFLQAFDDELSTYPPDAEWEASGRPSKAHPHGEDEGWWRTEGPQMVGRWVAWREASSWTTWVAPDETLGIELALMLPIGGELIKLYIDNIMASAPDNQRPIIVDKKSGSRDPEDLLIQLGFYKVAVELTWPEVKIAGGAYWNARRGTLSEVASLSQFTPEYIGVLARRVKEIRRIGAYLPSPSSLCKTCKVRRFCAINNGRDAHLDPDYNLLGGAR